jgi:hypothetical protein
MTEIKMDPIRPTVFEKKKNIVVVQSDSLLLQSFGGNASLAEAFLKRRSPDLEGTGLTRLGQLRGDLRRSALHPTELIDHREKCDFGAVLVQVGTSH